MTKPSIIIPPEFQSTCILTGARIYLRQYGTAHCADLHRLGSICHFTTELQSTEYGPCPDDIELVVNTIGYKRDRYHGGMQIMAHWAACERRNKLVAYDPVRNCWKLDPFAREP